jgi:hypothetical protein
MLKFAAFMQQLSKACDDLISGFVNLNYFQRITIVVIPELITFDAMER